MKSLLNNQRGAALITSLMLLSLMTVIGFSAMDNSDIELRIAGNERMATQSFYLAEAGIEHALSQLKDEVGSGDFSSFDSKYDDGALYSLVDSDGTSKDERIFGNGKYNVNLTRLNALEVKLVSEGHGAGNSVSKIEVVVELDPRTPVDPSFEYGILTDGDLRINGAPNITAPLVHANGRIDQNGTGTIDASVSAVGSVAAGSTITGDMTPWADPVDVPRPSDDATPDDDTDNRTHFQVLEEISKTGTNEYYGDGVEINLTGDQGGKVVYIDGDAEIRGSFSNASIVSTGNIDFYGSSQLGGDVDSGEGVVQVAVISGGDVVINGSNDSYGVFWSEGSFVQNGASMVHGSIVSSGLIRRNGEFNFTYNGNIDNDILPEDEDARASLEITSWRQL